MSQLTIYHENHPQTPIAEYSTEDGISRELAQVGVRFERWIAQGEIPDHATNEAIIAAYQSDIDRLVAETGYQTYDVISLTPDHPQKRELRQKFLAEHTHDDDEIRFFNRGKGLFTLHIEDKVYEVICEKNDLISVPAGTRHWFDMGENPDFTCIRLFDSPQGWVANFTGSDIADKFSRLAT
jgi:1,2-dihydroxy-3-keto-5-methylthiopentene dioxygenase